MDTLEQMALLGVLTRQSDPMDHLNLMNIPLAFGNY